MNDTVHLQANLLYGMFKLQGRWSNKEQNFCSLKKLHRKKQQESLSTQTCHFLTSEHSSIIFLVSTSVKWKGSSHRHQHEQNRPFTGWIQLGGAKGCSEKWRSAVALGYPERLQPARREKTVLTGTTWHLEKNRTLSGKNEQWEKMCFCRIKKNP